MHIYSQIIQVDGEEQMVITMNQLAHETGRLPNQIRNMASQIEKSGATKLDRIFPFPDSDDSDDKHSGPVFLLYNDKVKEFIKWCKKKPITR